MSDTISEASPDTGSFLRGMRAAFLAALVLLSLLAVSSHFILEREISRQSVFTSIASYAERQRTITQRITLFGLSLVSTSDPEKREQFRREIGALADLLEQTHDGLTKGAPSMNPPTELSDEIHRMYFSPPLSVDARIRTFIAQARALVGTPESGLSLLHPSLRELTALSTGLLADYETIVEQLRSESRSAVDQLRNLEKGVLAATLGCLLLTGALVFRPMLRRIRREFRAREVTEARLVSSEAELRVITDAASDAIFAVDDGLRTVFANPAAARIFDHPHEMALWGQPFLDLVDPETAPLFDRALREVAKGGALTAPIELRGKRRAGETIPIELLIGDGTRRGVHVYIITVRDISRRKEVEEANEKHAWELEHYAAELEQSNKELEDFCSIVSHDLKAPLHQVSSYAQLLQRRYKGTLGKDAEEFIGFMIEGVNRMKTLITDLLTLSRVATRGQPFAPVDLEGVVDEALQDLKSYVAESGAKIEVGELPKVDGDRSQLRQLIQNLVQNAVKFRRAGVEPVVRLEGSVTLGDGMVELRVEDNGIGFDQSAENQIFKPFHRLPTEQKYEGTGMGLAICKRIVERHRGKIRAESAPGEGTRFIVLLPAVKEAEASPSLTEASSLPTESSSPGSEASTLRAGGG